MFGELDKQDAIWRNQKSVYGLSLVKRWKLLTSCGVHVIILSTVQLFLLVKRSGDIFDLIGDEDPTNEDGDTEVSVSLGKISPEGKKSWESDIGDCDNTRDGGKTASRAIITWGGEIALYACMASIYGSSCKDEKISISKRYLVKSLREFFLDIVGK
nr:hypothetical protein [Tanacetum cinerariifolium]